MLSLIPASCCEWRGTQRSSAARIIPCSTMA